MRELDTKERIIRYGTQGTSVQLAPTGNGHMLVVRNRLGLIVEAVCEIGENGKDTVTGRIWRIADHVARDLVRRS